MLVLRAHNIFWWKWLRFYIHKIFLLIVVQVVAWCTRLWKLLIVVNMCIWVCVPYKVMLFCKVTNRQFIKCVLSIKYTCEPIIACKRDILNFRLSQGFLKYLIIPGIGQVSRDIWQVSGHAKYQTGIKYGRYHATGIRYVCWSNCRCNTVQIRVWLLLIEVLQNSKYVRNWCYFILTEFLSYLAQLPAALESLSIVQMDRIQFKVPQEWQIPS